MAGDREKALQAGCNDYDTKPIEFPRLLAKIEALLNGRG
jgi:DNA-binding response OmpR family regulator